ncbi:MAG: type VII toxin-antitoxin system HepT family RNase toxin [Armatimonadota bacterium]
MIDRERVLAKLADLDSYLNELSQVAPSSFEEYVRSIEKRRACERLLQISVETVIDICAILVQSLRLGLPAEEDDIFEKLVSAGVISREMVKTLRRMKGFRNILVHEYGRVDDRIVFDIIVNRMDDFEVFKREILEALRKFQPQVGE